MYIINPTDKSKIPISIQDNTIDISNDITLFGRSEQKWGDVLQEDLLHILENFASNGTLQNTPDFTNIIPPLLTKPRMGQYWFNKTTKTLNFYDGVIWNKIANENIIAANWGVIQDGATLPLPIRSGISYTYQDCVWIVGPYNYPQEINSLNCSIDINAKVTMQYVYKTDPTNTIHSGYANYLIIAIKDNINYLLPQITPTPSISPTPSIFPTPSPSLSIGISQLPTQTPTPTPTRTPIQSPTPTPSPSLSPYSTPPPTPTTTPTPSPNFITSATLSSTVAIGSCIYPHPSSGTCTASANLITITAVGGIGPYIVTAEYVSGTVISSQIANITPTTFSVEFWATLPATSLAPTHTSYYRMKIVDSNGGIVYSPNIKIELTAGNTA